METEIWKEIEGHPCYMISDEGRFLSKKSGEDKIIKCGLSGKKGKQYYHAALSTGKSIKYMKIHRLVGLYFLERIPGKNFINHKDGNKLNNRKDNVEWCTRSENQQHAWDTGLKTVSKKMEEHTEKLKYYFKGKTGEHSARARIIYQFTLEGEFIKSWHGADEIQRELGFKGPNIRKCCTGLRKRMYGFLWKYTLN